MRDGPIRFGVIGLCLLFCSIATGANPSLARSKFWGSNVLPFRAQSTGAERQSTSRNEGETICADMSNDYYARPSELPKNVTARMLRTATGHKISALAAEWKVEPESLLRGKQVRVSASSGVVFVVTRFPGNNPTDFWLVQQSSQRAKILLRVSATCVQVATGSSRGFRDITATYVPYQFTYEPLRTETYRYDGKTYKLTRRRTVPAMAPSDSAR